MPDPYIFVDNWRPSDEALERLEYAKKDEERRKRLGLGKPLMESEEDDAE